MEHRHSHRRVNLGDCETEEEILDSIEQSRKITRLIISAVQKGSKFEVSQILEHYGLPMTSRLHFRVVNIAITQWFSLAGVEGEEEIFNILKKNKFAMDKLRQSVPQGTIVVSDLLTEWELPIGALQSKVIRKLQDYFKEAESLSKGDEKSKKESNDQKDGNSDNPAASNT